MISSFAETVEAETLTFQSDDEIMVVRGRQSSGDSKFELLSPKDGAIQCIAFGHDGKPLAVQSSFAELGFVRFSDINIEMIDRVVCKWRG